MAVHENLYVVDASVMIKWLFQGENDAEFALALRNDYLEERVRLAVPSHSFYEIANAVGLKNPEMAASFISQILTFGMEEYDFVLSLTLDAIGLIKEVSGISFYDAVYHALAIKLGGTFVTADEKYFQKTKKLGRVMRLKDYA